MRPIIAGWKEDGGPFGFGRSWRELSGTLDTAGNTITPRPAETCRSIARTGKTSPVTNAGNRREAIL